MDQSYYFGCLPYFGIPNILLTSWTWMICNIFQLIYFLIPFLALLATYRYKKYVYCTCLCYVHNNASKLCIHHLILFRSHHSFKWTETALFNCNKLGPTWNSKLMKVSRYTLISNQESHKYQYMYIIGWLVSSTRKCIIKNSTS